MSTPRHHRPRVLVTGGSIAGPALAWALHREGYAVTVLERSPEQREAGQNIDVRGLGHEVLRRMGIRDEVVENLTGEVGIRYVDRSGRAYAELPTQEGRDGPTAEIEILRGKLSQILVDRIVDDVEIRYGDFVTDVDQTGVGVEITTDAGRREHFDLMVVAEGRSSRTRRLLFADRTRYLDKGISIAYGTIDRRDGDTDWWTWLNATEGRSVAVRPDNLGTLRAHLSFRSPAFGFENLPMESQIQVLRERFRDVGWHTSRVIDGFVERPAQFYTERMAQVLVSRWSTGRVALVGDAAWGSGPTGMGTTLSLVGSHVLAGELGRVLRDPSDTYENAFDRYESVMRGYADSAQGLPPGMPGLMNPMSSTGLSAVRTALRVASTKPMRSVMEKAFLTSERHVPELAEYPRLRG